MDANDGVYVGEGAWVSVAWRGLYEVKCKVPGSNGQMTEIWYPPPIDKVPQRVVRHPDTQLYIQLHIQPHSLRMVSHITSV